MLARLKLEIVGSGRFLGWLVGRFFSPWVVVEIRRTFRLETGVGEVLRLAFGFSDLEFSFLCSVSLCLFILSEEWLTVKSFCFSFFFFALDPMVDRAGQVQSLIQGIVFMCIYVRLQYNNAQ